MFKDVNTNLKLTELEEKILKFWEENDTFRKLVEKNRGNEKFIFYDGPITANNPMGVHHAWGRTYKDIYQRFKAMHGYDQRYQNGFDCQGLWVEVEVEKDLELDSKREILEFGLDRFAKMCRERVLKYAGIQTEQSKRLGQWMDWDNSYYTMDDNNIEHIWHFLKKCWEKGWLYEGERVLPWCPRCGTSLSQHELIDAYEEMTHNSTYIKLPIKDRTNEYFLVWTTTPWTLPANTALAVHPELDYLKVRQGEEVYYLSKGTAECLKGDYEALDTIKGNELVGLPYTGPFEHLPVQQDIKRRVVPWKEVGEDEGTGIVHIAPGCGAEDHALGKEYGLGAIAPIDDSGYYPDGFDWLTGKNALEVTPEIIKDLEKRGILYKAEEYTHRYPHCWRCGHELVFRLDSEWFISCDEIREDMKRAAAEVNWIPDHSGKRMQDWLNNMGDWCISRKRFWGLPLPFFRCGECGEVTVIGSLDELKEKAIEGLDQLDNLHRPWMDQVKIACPNCGKPAKRIREVGDCWMDAGIIPFSTLNYLHNHSYWEDWFPADFEVEMREQIRLWFYAQLFMSVALENTAPYQTILTYEKVHDEDGRPMHKSWGNAIWFDDAVDKMGADVMRWIYAAQNNEINLNFGFKLGDEITRKLLTLWNTYAFFVTYAKLDNWQPKPELLERMTPASLLSRAENTLDRWLLARLNELVRGVNDNLDNYRAAAVMRDVEAFLDELSNWYVRRNRRRFWKGQDDEDKELAYQTLYHTLVTFAKLLAPILPFTTEAIYQNIVAGQFADAPESIHLCEYPVANVEAIDEKLVASMDTVMKVVKPGHAARNTAAIKVRQPLAKVYVSVPENEVEAVLTSREIILDELNIKDLEIITDNDQFQVYVVKPKLPVVGPKYGKLAPKIKDKLERLSQEQAAAAADGQAVTIDVDGQEITLGPDELLISREQDPAFAVAGENGYLVAIDTKISEELKREGLAREIIRNIQVLRKEEGFDVDARINIEYQADNELKAVFADFADYISRETLAVALVPKEEELPDKVEIESHSISLKLEVV